MSHPAVRRVPAPGLRSRFATLHERAACLLLCACAGVTPATGIPEKARPDADEPPPTLPAARPWSFAASAPVDGEPPLDNGLALRVLERPSPPLLELRLVIRGGSASDGERPGVAALTLGALEQMAELSSGRQLAAQAEALGARLGLQTRRDASVISLSLPSVALEEGLSLLTALTVPPSWAPAAFEAARARELARVRLLRESAAWLAERALYAELFRAAPRPHPYAHADALPSDLERLTLDDSKRWYERNFSPRNATLLIVGDSPGSQLRGRVQRALGSWQGQEVVPPPEVSPPAPARPKTLLVHRAGATRSEVRIAALGPARAEASWPAFAAAQQVLGGDEGSRLRRELTRRGELDVDLRSGLVPVARGATPLLIAAVADTERTGLTLAALLDSLALLASEQPSQRELRAARQQLLASAPLELGTSFSAAELLLQNELWQLPSKALDDLQRRLAQLTPSDLQNSARRHLLAAPVVVVVGDAARLLTPLRRFGQVHLLDAERDFRTERVVSQDPTAPLEGPDAAPSSGAEPPSSR